MQTNRLRGKRRKLTFDEAGDIDDIQEGGDFGGGFPMVAKPIVSLIRNGTSKEKEEDEEEEEDDEREEEEEKGRRRRRRRRRQKEEDGKGRIVRREKRRKNIFFQ